VRSLVGVALLAAFPAGVTAQTLQARIVFGTDTILADVAATEDEHIRGLQGRTRLGEREGMLFVFEGERTRSFWMEGTPLDLDIAFLDAAFRVVDIQHMKANSTRIHDSASPAMYALEVRSGWFADHNVRVGSTPDVTFLDAAPPIVRTMVRARPDLRSGPTPGTSCEPGAGTPRHPVRTLHR